MKECIAQGGAEPTSVSMSIELKHYLKEKARLNFRSFSKEVQARLEDSRKREEELEKAA
ncbi:TraY domain-containing protein [Chromobacterium haemolyticum]|uniref:TraY domain-containing protein n=1 Tax=Chromobacterium haemolyticum TaxID=394935 RepID=UPI001318552C|nr:TraY domain-containing protein [Chromobacterium haemolyticum]BBH13355.1 hypothetical protein CH06BL_26030 [Chromobacterium haemolyticum]